MPCSYRTALQFAASAKAVVALSAVALFAMWFPFAILEGAVQPSRFGAQGLARRFHKARAGGGGSNENVPVKTTKLLILRKARNAESAVSAISWHVYGTRSARHSEQRL